jgi:CheY-like chemotaxis protein
VAKLKKTILVADDEAASRSLLREILQEAGYNVLEAVDGQEALELIEKKSPDLLITDRSMPRLGGLELLAKLREKKQTLPVLMLSAYGEESFWGQAIGLGAVDYLLKPFKTEDVLSLVRKSLSGVKKP